MLNANTAANAAQLNGFIEALYRNHRRSPSFWHGWAAKRPTAARTALHVNVFTFRNNRDEKPTLAHAKLREWSPP